MSEQRIQPWAMERLVAEENEEEQEAMNAEHGRIGGRILIDEVARGEVVEGDLDRLIERRSRGVDPDENTDLWRESVRKHNARHREARLWERLNYHQAMLDAHTRNFEELLRRHRVGIRLVEEALGIAGRKGEAA